MQQYVTPLPGRSPEPNITNRDDYKLDIRLKEFRQNEHLLTVRKFIPETNWTEQKFFLTQEELARLQDAITCKE
jgi:hypothetical protein